MRIEPQHGVLNLFKPPGRSSAQYVYKLRPIVGLRKVGHAGTLDPFAEGVLLACAGSGTSLVERLMSLPKQYETTLQLGVTNATFDTEQPFEPVPGITPPTRDAVDAALLQFIGTIEQVPPVHSAIKVRGVPSYQLARQQRAPTPAAKRVMVHGIILLEYAWPDVRLRIDCGRGTYIRALARDLGAILGCGACCRLLRRTAVGPFRVESAMDIRTASDDAIRAAMLSNAEIERLISG